METQTFDFNGDRPLERLSEGSEEGNATDRIRSRYSKMYMKI
jgi:hypothetical protein